MSEQKREDGKPHKKRKIKQKPVLEQVPQVAKGAAAAAEDGNSKFARALGSTDYGTREKGLQALSRWLVHKDSMPELDMMKLWKGLFFCFWHSDKVPVQTDLAERLAGLLTQLQPHMAQLYWAGLLATLRREWFAMDHHRLNKFLMLVRKFVAALFTRLAAANWDASAISSLTSQLPLGQAPLIPPTANKSLGLSYHLADVWLQELRKVADEQAVPAEALLLLLEPFIVVLEAGGEQALLQRVKESVFDVLASDLAAAAAGEDAEQQSLYCEQLDVQQLAEQLFSRGAVEGVKSRNRQALYSASKDLERIAGKRRRKAEDAGAAAEQQQQLKEKKGHKKHKQMDQLEHQQQQQQPQQLQQQQELLQQADATPAKKKKKLHKQEQQQQQQPQQQQPPEQQQVGQQPPMANGVTPSSSKKRARAQQADGAAAPATPAAAAAAADADASTPKAGTAQKSGKKKKRTTTETYAAAATPAAAEDATAPSTAKKGVKINLKKNVYFAHGAPVPPAEIRSPPATKPKGSALKVKAGTPATAPAKQQQGSRLGQRKAVTPNSVPRVKAAAFF